MKSNKEKNQDWREVFVELLPAEYAKIRKLAKAEKRPIEDLVFDAAHNWLVERKNAFLYQADGTGGCTWLSEAARDWTGITVENLGDNWLEILCPKLDAQARETILRGFEPLLRKGRNYAWVWPVRRRDGVYRWVLDKGTVRHDADGNFIGYDGQWIELSEEIQHSLALVNISGPASFFNPKEVKK